jgi:Hint domain-containing protein
MGTMALLRLPLVILLGSLLALAVACSGNPAPSGSPGPTPTPSPTPSPSPSPIGELSPAELRYALLAQFSPISWCDPDFYPIARQDEQVSADEHWAQITADIATYDAIVAHLALDGTVAPADRSAPERLAIYREWKLLNAVQLQPLDGAYAFDLISETDPGLGRGIRSAGTIDTHGAIELALQDPSNLTACPICLTRGTLIDTPDGPVSVEVLRVGDVVWTLDGAGHRVAQPLVRVGSTPVPESHEVVHLVLADGRAAWVSPGHPTSDGRQVGQLQAGDAYDGSSVVSAERALYDGGRTFDILPASSTGVYWANGILLGSTLR